MQSHELLAWLIFAAPLASFLTIVFLLRPAGLHQAASQVTILAMSIAFALSLAVLNIVINTPGHELEFPDYPWISVGETRLHIGLAVDSLTAVMLVVVTSVSLLVQIYSTGYMAGDTGYSRYFAYMSLFTTSMLGLVLADNLLQVFMFWELVGLCSYLLVGFWFHRPSAATAAKKAFLVTRFGDLGFMAALVYIFSMTHTFTIAELFTEQTVHEMIQVGFLGITGITWVTLGLFAGAAGKSAQFPLHVWLPDAMEGPTPVSALIHAATMVAAGVYLVGRMLPLFHHAPDTMHFVACIGAFTALTAAGIGLVVTDIKRVMAYSTISQLGYMMLALGSGAYVAAFFHLMNHAFFKALLFLGSGSVNHTTGTFNMKFMGGLKDHMPWTFRTLLIASLSLAGIPPLSGFWSKDEILGAALAYSPMLFVLALATVFMTAFYVFRMMILTFGDEYRGGVEAETAATGIPAPAAHYSPHAASAHDDELAAHGAASAHDQPAAHDSHGSGHALHESPAVMIVPLMVLAVPSVLSGLVNLPDSQWLAHFLTTHTIQETLGEHHLPFNPGLAALSVATALAGIGLAWQIYGSKEMSVEPYRRFLGGFPYRLLNQKYYLDLIVERLITSVAVYWGAANVAAQFDRYVVDGVVNWVGRGIKATGNGLRQLESGQVQAYGLVIFLGIILLSAGIMVRG